MKWPHWLRHDWSEWAVQNTTISSMIFGPREAAVQIRQCRNEKCKKIKWELI